MEALLEDGVVLKKVVVAVVDLAGSANMTFSPEGLHFRAIDSSHISLVDVRMATALFKGWEVPPEGVNLGVNLAALRRVLGMVSPGDQLRLKWDPTRPDLLNVQFASVARRRNYDIDMRLMDIDAEGLDIPDMEYTHVIRLPSADFYQCVADCAQFGDTVGVAVGGDRVVTAVDGDEAKTFMSLEGDAHVTPDGAPPVNMKFSTKYILAFAKARDNDKTVTLKMLDGFPICVEFAVGGHDDSRLTFYLAPKMDDEETTT